MSRWDVASLGSVSREASRRSASTGGRWDQPLSTGAGREPGQREEADVASQPSAGESETSVSLLFRALGTCTDYNLSRPVARKGDWRRSGQSQVQNHFVNKGPVGSQAGPPGKPVDSIRLLVPQQPSSLDSPSQCPRHPWLHKPCEQPETRQGPREILWPWKYMDVVQGGPGSTDPWVQASTRLTGEGFHGWEECRGRGPSQSARHAHAGYPGLVLAPQQGWDQPVSQMQGGGR